MPVRFDDHSDEIKQKMKEAVARAMEKCGMTAEGYAKKLAPVDVGRLRNSISHTVDDGSAYIGTDLEYAPYVELGTGIYNPGGRQTPWVYQDIKGNWHMTHGQEAQPYLKPAVADHAPTYRNIIKTELESG